MEPGRQNMPPVEKAAGCLPIPHCGGHFWLPWRPASNHWSGCENKAINGRISSTFSPNPEAGMGQFQLTLVQYGVTLIKQRRCCSGGRLVCRGGRASRRPERTMEDMCGSEFFQAGWCGRGFSPPGGTPGLYGRQDARRHGKAAGVGQCQPKLLSVFGAALWRAAKAEGVRSQEHAIGSAFSLGIQVQSGNRFHASQ